MVTLLASSTLKVSPALNRTLVRHLASISKMTLVCVNLRTGDLFLTRVVNTSLDDIIQGEAAGGGLAPQLAVDLLVQHLRQITGW